MRVQVTKMTNDYFLFQKLKANLKKYNFSPYIAQGLSYLHYLKKCISGYCLAIFSIVYFYSNYAYFRSVFWGMSRLEIPIKNTNYRKLSNENTL